MVAKKIEHDKLNKIIKASPLGFHHQTHLCCLLRHSKLLPLKIQPIFSSSTSSPTADHHSPINKNRSNTLSFISILNKTHPLNNLHTFYYFVHPSHLEYFLYFYCLPYVHFHLFTRFFIPVIRLIHIFSVSFHYVIFTNNYYTHFYLV